MTPPYFENIFCAPSPSTGIHIQRQNLSYISLIFWQILAFFWQYYSIFLRMFCPPPLNFIVIAYFGQIMKIWAHIPWLCWGYFLTPLLLNGDFATFKITLHVVPFLTNYVIFAYNILVLFWGDSPPPKENNHHDQIYAIQSSFFAQSMSCFGQYSILILRSLDKLWRFLANILFRIMNFCLIFDFKFSCFFLYPPFLALPLTRKTCFKIWGRGCSESYHDQIYPT